MMLNFVIKLIFTFNILFLIKNFLVKLTSKIIEQPIFLTNRLTKYVSILSTGMFVIFFRFLKLFLYNKGLIDLKEYYFIVEYLGIINTFFLSFCVIFVLFFLKKLLVCWIKLNYLRVHYYYFSRSFFYLKSIKLLENMEYKFFQKLKKKEIYAYMYIIFYFFFKVALFVFLLKNIIFDDYVIYVGWLPWYALYYFLINVNFFFKSMVMDFERGSLQCYYGNYFFTTKLGFYKLYHYHKYLITSTSKYKFQPCEIYNLELRYFIPNYWVFYFYRTFNIIDVYSIKEKPKILKNKF